jgi:hypothetical protein
MSSSVRFDVGRPLDEAQRATLETQLARRLGLVTCVRHPPAIDDVTVERSDAAATVVVSACCEFSARRAKMLVGEAIKNLPASRT